jgi:hypothetical protein
MQSKGPVAVDTLVRKAEIKAKTFWHGYGLAFPEGGRLHTRHRDTPAVASQSRAITRAKTDRGNRQW